MKSMETKYVPSSDLKSRLVRKIHKQFNFSSAKKSFRTGRKLNPDLLGENQKS